VPVNVRLTDLENVPVGVAVSVRYIVMRDSVGVPDGEFVISVVVETVSDCG
jgi:hypothetical protein